MWLKSEKRWEALLKVKAIAKGRPKFSTRGGFPRSYTPAKTRQAEESLRKMIFDLDPPMFTGAVAVNIICYFVRPKSAKKRLYPSVRPDLDNFVKTIFDSMNGLVIQDDSQVVQMCCSKNYGADDAISIQVFSLED